MQCSNCQFENMPGVQSCGRCGASLQLATLAIDVHPPRASRAAKRWRRWFPVARHWNRLRDAAAGSLASIRIPGCASDMQTPSVLLRMIVPGWAQRYTGRIGRAKLMFWCYLGLLLSGLLFLGTALGWLFVGLAISLHAASILDIVATTISDYRQRMIYAAVAMILLIAVVYYPAGRLLALVASPQQFVVAAPPFAAGDVVLVNPSAYRWSEPQPGDVVHYRLPEGDVWGQDRGYAYRLQGDRIDRILARGGQKVACSQGKLLIDGRPSPWLPLNPQQLPEGLDVLVPKDCYLIVASTAPLPLTVQRFASIVPRNQIWGQVYWRSQPLWRLGRIH
jgi:hypothetical protein